MRGDPTSLDSHSVTRAIRELEKKPDAAKLEALKERAERSRLGLHPWRKRLEALERLVAVHEVMES